jgi:hypothetical protein
MKKLSVILALLALFFANLAFAAGAVITSVTGTAQVQTGTATPRALRMGDEVAQGDNVSTGPNSSVVMKFDDGEVTALTANSRMMVTAYQYNPSSGTGNVLLSLVTGGMRAITGLIGQRNPKNVAYRAATATIGIRGTDATIVTDGSNVIFTVSDGTIDVTVNGKSYSVSRGESLFVDRSGNVVGPAATAQVFKNSLPALVLTVEGLVGNVISQLIGQAVPGLPRQTETHDTNATVTTTGVVGGTTVGSGTGGGTPVSPH